jgi:hypothetical protein
MKCKITCGVPKPYKIKLKKHSLLNGDKEVTWWTNDEGVIYQVHVPPGMFKGCTAAEGCNYLVKKGQEPTEVLAASAKVTPGTAYGISVFSGSLPGTCPGFKQQDPPVIIVEDFFDAKGKPVEKAVAKKKAAKKKAK